MGQQRQLRHPITEHEPPTLTVADGDEVIARDGDAAGVGEGVGVGSAHHEGLVEDHEREGTGSDDDDDDSAVNGPGCSAVVVGVSSAARRSVTRAPLAVRATTSVSSVKAGGGCEGDELVGEGVDQAGVVVAGGGVGDDHATDIATADEPPVGPQGEGLRDDALEAADGFVGEDDLGVATGRRRQHEAALTLEGLDGVFSEPPGGAEGAPRGVEGGELAIAVADHQGPLVHQHGRDAAGVLHPPQPPRPAASARPARSPPAAAGRRGRARRRRRRERGRPGPRAARWQRRRRQRPRRPLRRRRRGGPGRRRWRWRWPARGRSRPGRPRRRCRRRSGRRRRRPR